jgi:hypothetical protein
LATGVRRALALVVPEERLGFLEYYAAPHHREPYGGPLNGQTGRRRIVREICSELPIDFVWETGTFRGSSTAFLAGLLDKPIVTVEIDARNFGFARARLRSLPNVTQRRGESVEVMKRHKESFGRDQLGLFYLDAHWREYLPLADEIGVIRDYWRDYVILVDDFQVVDDAEYQFDDYGPRKALTLDYLPREVVAECRLFWPSLRAADEDGARRGCVVIASERPGAALAKLPSLRPHRAGAA